MDSNEIYCDKLTAGLRTYFFDIKKSENGSLYLKISESKKSSNKFIHYRIMIFEEDIQNFAEKFKKSVSTFNDHNASKFIAGKTKRTNKLRKT